LTTRIGFVITTVAKPPSPMRQLAYEQDLPIPGPLQDPDGWRVLSPIIVKGRIPDGGPPLKKHKDAFPTGKPVEVEVTVSNLVYGHGERFTHLVGA